MARTVRVFTSIKVKISDEDIRKEAMQVPKNTMDIPTAAVSVTG